MTKQNHEDEIENNPNPYLKEQDKGIIEAFSRSKYHVLTNSEIAENVNLSRRQVRRRLDDLAKRNVIGKREVSGVKLAWLEENVKEPITVQYPLLRYVRDHTSIQLFLIGVAGGIVSVLVLLGAAISVGYGVQVPYISQTEFLIYGALSAAVSGIFIVVALLAAILEWSFHYFDYL